ncbi:hypothetical protein LTS10_008509 [Elasticomyces elasticus]|nr:hypothetical protein LTS10_008509 [Elasticomyces elasticus]
MAPLPTHPREAYTFGIICALDVEKAAVKATLDGEHSGVEKIAGDDNSYSFGRIGQHDVVLACLPAGVTGKASAAMVAKDMMRSFPIKAGFLVGIGGGVWSDKTDVRLGDVVVSQPDGMHGGVVQWDFGKMEREGVFRRTGTLNKPPLPLLNALQSLKARHEQRGDTLHMRLEEMLSRNPLMAERYGYQGQEHDQLFEASYDHLGGDTCDDCTRSRLVQRRPERKDDRPMIHYGNIASGDEVVKDGLTRDRIAREEGILCFEMEAAGLVETFPCVVIRGVCDYADSHKNKRWQRYAAATAACFAKELLSVVDSQRIQKLDPPPGQSYPKPQSLWQCRYDMTSDLYNSTFQDLVSQDYRLNYVSGYTVNNEVRSSPEWATRHGMTSAQYQIAFDDFVNRGYRTVLVNGYAVNGEDRYVAIWEKSLSDAWVARHGMTSSDYQTAFDTCTGQGYQLVHISGYAVGNEPRYAAIWEKTCGSRQWVAVHGLTSSAIQQRFNTCVGEGYRLTLISGYSVNNVDYYAAIWLKEAGLAWVAKLGLTTAQFKTEFNAFMGQGYVLKVISGYTLSGSSAYAAIWQK